MTSEPFQLLLTLLDYSQSFRDQYGVHSESLLNRSATKP